MARRPKGRNISGIVLIDKPLGISSNHALQRVKRLYQAAKAGHTGALDPLATGMLPICFGEATKFSQFLLDTDKKYFVTGKLGERTTTSDADGEVIQERPVEVSQTQLNTAVEQFRGKQQQMPSMYSALKYQGQPLYKYAREGIEVPRKIRDIEVFSIELLRFEADEVDLLVHCSKGTYIRTIIDDLGEVLGCGAHVKVLRRTEVGAFRKEQMLTIEQLEELLPDNETDEVNFDALDNHMLPIDTALQDLPVVFLSEEDSQRVSHGNPVATELDDVDVIRIQNDSSQQFLGIGRIESGQVKPKRLVQIEQ
ncbi:tRNA pseudouridine(55) synthase TruB [Algicola sagamiensis]|uniref:tRNA pseudouridine(55) synthase TruB n=1 Tax=Algicola sagamiensis TaxID=163869 RepID=UPI00035FD571|nr:tRNA pseudouridine(55) synthase TruB [Algicola sagamiensis]